MQAVTGTKLALLPDEPVGLIPTRTPGSVSFEAKLTWRELEEAIWEKICPIPPKSVKVLLDEHYEPEGSRLISGEIRAFAERDLEETLDSILRNVTSIAAASEAVLEVRSVRNARARVVSLEVLEKLALGVWEVGFGVRFGPCWTPLCGETEAAVGIRSAEDAHERLGDMDSWEITSRHL